MSADARLKAALHRAVGLENDGDLFGAEQIYRQLTARPQPVPHAHYHYAQLLLRRGDYVAAWPHFMKRIEDPEYTSRSTANLTQPYLGSVAAEAVAGKTVLVYCDQGIGDAVMCARFIPELAARAGRVVFVVFEGFRDLFESLAEAENVDVMEFGEALPPFDAHADLFSLPALFAVTPETIPKPEWLRPNREWRALWQSRLPADRMNIGLVWQGNPNHNRDAERSAKLNDYLPLFETGHNFVNLQAGHGADQAELPDAPPALQTFDEITGGVDVRDGQLVNCAALIDCLDLVITVDTAMAHLAGALGKPAWVLVTKVPYWVFMEAGAGTPWYPKTRVFRGHARYSWTVEVAEMTALLGTDDPLAAAAG